MGPVLTLLILSGGCGSEPLSSSPTVHLSVTNPSPTPPDVVNMAGTWTGTLEAQDQAVQQVTLTVVQSTNCVDGTWRSTSSDSRGAISGFAGKDSYTGLFSLERGSCIGVVTITGEVGTDALRLTGGPVTKSAASGTCADPLPASLALSLRRQ